MGGKTVLTITGRTCAGKSTLAHLLLRQPGFARVISHTTRPPRAGERAGDAYHFVDTGVFEAMLADGALLEHVRPDGLYYGTSVAAFETCFAQGCVAVAVCDPAGRAAIQAHGAALGWRVISVWLDNPDAVIAARFVERLLAGAATAGAEAQAVQAGFAARLAAMLGREQDWRGEAGQPGIYGLGFDHFDAGSEAAVVARIVQACAG